MAREWEARCCELRNSTPKTGAAVALLSTHSFQSPGFYIRMGYEQQASVKDHPVGHSNVFYAKRLPPNAAHIALLGDSVFDSSLP